MSKVQGILEVLKLHKFYVASRGNIVPAIEDISFSITPREFLCIVGPSGCGKSTLLRLLAGLLKPDTGQIYLKQQTLKGPRPEIGLVFQKANLMPWRTVFDNIFLALQLKGISRHQAKERIETVLALVGLSDFATAYPHELSGGMQQRVAIARALVPKPEILLLDEPFGALDALTRENLNLELMRLWEVDRKTVIMVTHNIREAVFLADRVLVLSSRPGRLISKINIDLPRPRKLSLFYESHFQELTYQVRQKIV